MKKFVSLVGSLVLVGLLAGCYGEGVLIFDGPVYETLVVDSIDDGDGYLFTDDGTTVMNDGIYVEDGYTEGYVTFPLSALPPWARIVEATLFLGVVDVYLDSPPVEVAMERVDFALPLSPSVLWRQGAYYGTFRLYGYDAGNYVAVDVTDMVVEAFLTGAPYLQVRFSAFYGGVDFEDGGNNLGSFLVPRLEVTYY